MRGSEGVDERGTSPKVEMKGQSQDHQARQEGHGVTTLCCSAFQNKKNDAAAGGAATQDFTTTLDDAAVYNRFACFFAVR